MSDAVIVALISAAAMIGAQIIISRRNTQDLYAKLDKQSEIEDERIKAQLGVMNERFSELERKVDKHNSVIERTYHLEQTSAVMEEKIKVANNRIADLEKAARVS